MIKKILAGIAVLTVLCMWWATRVSPGSIVIERYGSVGSAVEKMYDAGIIRSPLVAKIFIRIFMRDAEVFPGKVVVAPGCAWMCAMSQLVSADRSGVRMTFPEGDDLRDIQKRVQGVDAAAAKKIFLLTGTPAVSTTPDDTFKNSFIFLRDVPARISYEGYLFPDTYSYDANGGARGLVTQMFTAFQEKIATPFAQDISTSGHSLHEIITVASLLEKEVVSDEDRTLVADIIWRRLRAGMPLQLDASVSYIYNDTARFTTRVQRETDSPWNTYARRGLPVGPICNPGVSAVRAALHPRENSYWFYLTAPDGTVHYARTLEEHIANKKYLR